KWVAINNNAKWVAAAGYGKLYIWDAHSREKLREIEMDASVIGNLAISPDGSEILIEANWSFSIYDVATQKEAGVIKYWKDGDLDACWKILATPLTSDRYKAYSRF